MHFKKCEKTCLQFEKRSWVPLVGGFGERVPSEERPTRSQGRPRESLGGLWEPFGFRLGTFFDYKSISFVMFLQHAFLIAFFYECPLQWSSLFRYFWSRKGLQVRVSFRLAPGSPKTPPREGPGPWGHPWRREAFPKHLGPCCRLFFFRVCGHALEVL